MFGGLQRNILQFAVSDQLRQGFKYQIWIDSAGAVSDQAAVMMDFAGFAGFDNQSALIAQPLSYQVMMNTGRGQQGRHGRHFLIDAAIT